jgi:hypothetical protein
MEARQDDCPLAKIADEAEIIIPSTDWFDANDEKDKWKDVYDLSWTDSEHSTTKQ